MNRQDFSITNGFPLNQAALDRMQTAYALFNAFGNIVGDKTIISGCVLTGSNVSNGVVFVNGEVFEFRGGVVQTKVIIKEDITPLLYKNGNAYPAVKTRYVTFGVGAGQMDWADFTRGIETKSISAELTNIDNVLTTILTKLGTIANYAEVNVQADFAQTDNTKDDFIKNKPAGTILYKGTYVVGDVSGSDDSRTVTFPNVGTVNYMVFPTVVSKGNEIWDNDVRLSIKDNRTATSFVVLLGDGYQGDPTYIQNIEIDFILIAK